MTAKLSTDLGGKKNDTLKVEPVLLKSVPEVQDNRQSDCPWFCASKGPKCFYPQNLLLLWEKLGLPRVK